MGTTSFHGIFPLPPLALASVAALLLVACSGSPTASVGTPADEDAGKIDDVSPTVPAADAGTESGPAPETDGGATPARCAAGSKTGAAGSTDALTTAGGRKYNVRTPSNYDPEVGSPLIVVYAPSGGTAVSIETATKLTPDAVKAGFVVAYVDTVSPANTTGAKDVAAIPDLVAGKWCVDRSRVYLTGSSDGGGLIYTIVLNHYMTPEPAAVAPFAAGASKNTLAQAKCLTPPMPVMVMHNVDDTVFPMYGRAARDYWVACNTCGAPTTLPDGCVAYQGCAGGAEIRYCEGPGGHGRWPALHTSMFDFFLRFSRP